MCWVTFDRENIRFKYALEDIPVYKVIKKSLLSYYENYSYILNEVHVTKLDNPSHTKHSSGLEDWKIRSGFHSYSMDCKAAIGLTSSLYVRILRPNNNFVSVDCYEINNTCMLECVIPKDSVYFLNEDGEYVSDHILPLKIKNW